MPYLCTSNSEWLQLTNKQNSDKTVNWTAYTVNNTQFKKLNNRKNETTVNFVKPNWKLRFFCKTEPKSFFANCRPLLCVIVCVCLDVCLRMHIAVWRVTVLVYQVTFVMPAGKHFCSYFCNNCQLKEKNLRLIFHGGQYNLAVMDITMSVTCLFIAFNFNLLFW